MVKRLCINFKAFLHVDNSPGIRALPYGTNYLLNMPDTPACELISWGEVHRLCRRLSGLIQVSGFQPGIVIAIGRGGYVPARLVCDDLDIMALAKGITSAYVPLGAPASRLSTMYLARTNRPKRLYAIHSVWISKINAF